MKAWISVAIAVSLLVGFASGWLLKPEKLVPIDQSSIPVSDSEQAKRIEDARKRVQQDAELARAQADEINKQAKPMLDEMNKTLGGGR